MKKNKIISWISTILVTLGALYMTVTVYKDPGVFLDVGVKSILFAYMLIPIALQGIVIKPLHLASIKLQHIINAEPFEPSDWKDKQLGMAYFIPLIQDVINNKQQRVYIDDIIESHEDEGYEVPKMFKISRINTKIYAGTIASLIILMSMIVLPKFTNDYDLYRGLTEEQLILGIVGIGLIIYSIITNINSKVTYEAMDAYLPSTNNPVESMILTINVVAASIIAFLTLGAIVTGVLSINVALFQFIFNFELIGIYILLTPVLLLVNAFLLKSQAMRYNIYLDTEVRNIY